MLFRTREFVEQSLRISSKSKFLKPQSLWRQPLFKGRHPLPPPRRGPVAGLVLLLSGSSMIFIKLKFIELALNINCLSAKVSLDVILKVIPSVVEESVISNTDF